MMLKPALRPPLRAPMRGATTLREGGGVPAGYQFLRAKNDGGSYVSLLAKDDSGNYRNLFGKAS